MSAEGRVDRRGEDWTAFGEHRLAFCGPVAFALAWDKGGNNIQKMCLFAKARSGSLPRPCGADAPQLGRRDAQETPTWPRVVVTKARRILLLHSRTWSRQQECDRVHHRRRGSS